MSIELNDIVQIDPKVLPVGQSQNTLVGLMLSQNAAIPNGVVLSFTTAEDIGHKLGYDSLEYRQAQVYFRGFTGSTNLPNELLVAFFPTTSTSAYLEGGDLSGMTLTELQSLSGSLAIIVDGINYTADNLVFSSVRSFSDAADYISANMQHAGGDPLIVNFSSGNNGFVISSAKTGSESSVGFAATGTTLAAPLRLTSLTGAVQSLAADNPSPDSIMTAIRHKNQKWATFFCAFDPADLKTPLAQWTDAQNRAVMAILHDTSEAITSQPVGQTWAERIKTLQFNGIFPIYHDPLHAAFVASIPACLDFTATDGRYTFAFRRQTGLAASVNDMRVANILESKGYNFYGDYASSTQAFNFLYPGSVTGEWLWADSYIDQIWLNRAFRAALVNLLINKGNIPYNTTGSAFIENAMQSTINQALAFGAIRPNITLSDEQKQNISAKYGQAAVNALQTRGWFLSVRAEAVAPQARVLRASPPCEFYYVDGQSVQRIHLASIEVQ
ncbi:DUF3383 family protein [Entomobacter blattae]|uniref:DUF3383 domain-containing protein n=1 Tax=Entomobacter blattae TaxID=2762277 RepID=A0A7H1NU46_9PROT|nr:DUF3383 family protein [Entomobacter blattae]QNT79306.1 hypothetical protein JGUZn3_21030 [Entomobacter blattae]